MGENRELKKSIGVLRDSFGTRGAYGRVVWQAKMVSSPSWAVSAGGGAFLFYRQFKFGGPREWMPALLPVCPLCTKIRG